MSLRRPITVALALVLVSCASRHDAPSASAPLSVPVQVVEAAKQKMPQLRKGMSDEEALHVLGLSGYRGQMLVSSGGSPSNWHNDYLLRRDCCLTLGSHGQGLESASLSGTVWP